MQLPPLLPVVYRGGASASSPAACGGAPCLANSSNASTLASASTALSSAATALSSADCILWTAGSVDIPRPCRAALALAVLALAAAVPATTAV